LRVGVSVHQFLRIGYGEEAIKTAFTILKIAVLTPMPGARTNKPTAVNPEFLAVEAEFSQSMAIALITK
jgi:hypothetical protein